MRHDGRMPPGRPDPKSTARTHTLSRWTYTRRRILAWGPSVEGADHGGKPPSSHPVRVRACPYPPKNPTRRASARQAPSPRCDGRSGYTPGAITPASTSRPRTNSSTRVRHSPSPPRRGGAHLGVCASTIQTWINYLIANGVLIPLHRKVLTKEE